MLPRFRPLQRRFDGPGAVSVMVLPAKAVPKPPNPRPDRHLIERVRGLSRRRRPLATELYVIGCEYVPLGVSVAIGIREGAARDQVVAVREALHGYCGRCRRAGATAPAGRSAAPWSTASSRSIVARVAGVRTTGGVNLFGRDAGGFRLLGETPPRGRSAGARAVAAARAAPADVVVDAPAPESLALDRPVGQDAVPIPVVPEVC